jgi:lipoprotein-releasing system permease protein
VQPFELFVGLRYTRARRRNFLISFTSLISIIGTALGVAALIIVLSVMNGFQKELRTRILGVVSHVQITGADNVLRDWEKVVQEVSSHPGVTGAAPFVSAQGLLSFSDSVRGTVVRGILPEREDAVADIGRHMKAGDLSDLRPGEFGIVLGSELARALQVDLGEQVVLIAPQGQVTPAGLLPRLKQFRVVGVFEVGMFEYDSGLALIHLKDAQTLYRMQDDVSGVRLKLDDLDDAPLVAREITRRISSDAFVSDWTRSHANWFRAVQIEKRVMFIILLLIVVVAAINIISTLVMVVTEKRPDIAILRTLGAKPSSIMQIFIVQGGLIGMLGTLIGVVLGVVIALNIDVVVPALEHAFNVQFLEKSVYYISDLPSDLQTEDVVVIVVMSLLISFVATLIPSYRASRVNPADALRYE